MSGLEPATLVMVTIVSVAAAVAAILLAARLGRRRPNVTLDAVRQADNATVFLFDGQVLVDATESARDIFANRDQNAGDLDHLISLLSRRFPRLNERIAGLRTGGQISIDAARGHHGRLVAEAWDGHVRVSLLELSLVSADGSDSLGLAAAQDELGTLRRILTLTPELIWKLDATGEIVWANKAYINLADRVRRADAGPDEPTLPDWPPRQIFDPVGLTSGSSKGTHRRASVPLPDTEPLWFDVTSVRSDTDTMFFACSADAVVKAEAAQRNFVQTLTKTFANLSIGLAIFDRHRELMLFNPALLDLTRLPVEFLSARPSLRATLDRLRELQMLPEPKNYQSWREEFTALELAAENGTYQETWNLPNGQIYRVTGRPHPDGAVAFLFEDISAEISLTRRFRAEIELGQTVIDQISEAVAVFAGSGAIRLMNRAYGELWDLDETGLDEISLTDAARDWQSRAAPAPIWGDLRDLVAGIGSRAEMEEPVLLRDGRQLLMRAVPLGSGETLVVFRQIAQSLPSAQPPERDTDRSEKSVPA